MTNANQEYNWPIPRGTKKIQLQARQNVDVRLSYESTGTEVAGAYWTLKSTHVYYEDCPLEVKDTKIYLRDPSNAGTIVEISYWIEVGN